LWKLTDREDDGHDGARHQSPVEIVFHIVPLRVFENTQYVIVVCESENDIELETPRLLRNVIDGRHAPAAAMG
jgi:hypothetical protein